jgi:hypothetical protein
VQRTFSSFPSGGAGAALLVLRLVVGASATLESGLVVGCNHTLALTTHCRQSSIRSRKEIFRIV